jgi:hypothetical protein
MITQTKEKAGRVARMSKPIETGQLLNSYD